MTPNELRAEAAAVDYEEGTDCTTRACLLRGAAEEIDRLHKGLAVLERRLLTGHRLKHQDSEWILFDADGECNDDSCAASTILNLVSNLGKRTY